MDTFFKILKFIFYSVLMIFAIVMKILAFFIEIFVGSSNKASKGYYKEVEENGNYTGKYD
ncbi:hypothetical protein GCM10027035_40340 [Emticicia sediminis]